MSLGIYEFLSSRHTDKLTSFSGNTCALQNGEDTWLIANILRISLSVSSVCIIAPSPFWNHRNHRHSAHCLADCFKFITDTVHSLWTKAVYICRQATHTPHHFPTYSSVILHVHRHTLTHKYTQVNTMPDILIEYLMWLKSLWREGCHCSVILFLHLLFVFWQCMNKNVTLWTDSQCVVLSSGLSWEKMKWHIVSDTDEVPSTHELSLWSQGSWESSFSFRWWRIGLSVDISSCFASLQLTQF